MLLYLLRHADADTIAETDDERALSEKGVTQAQKVARFCETHQLRTGMILSSPVRRAHETAQIVAEHLGVEVSVAPWLACGMRATVALAELAAYGGEHEPVMLVGHEPDLSGLAAHLMGVISGDRLQVRKASLTRLEVEDLERGGARLDFFVPCRLM
jgi:phosphohistidine phosphatase